MNDNVSLALDENFDKIEEFAIINGFMILSSLRNIRSTGVIELKTLGYKYNINAFLSALHSALGFKVSNVDVVKEGTYYTINISDYKEIE